MFLKISEFIYLAAETITDEFTERKVLEQGLNFGLIARKINHGGLECLSKPSFHLRKDGN